MELEVFKKKIMQKGNAINIEISKEKAEKFYKYMEMLLYWNERINLTAITEPEDVILKHFIDSITIYKYIDNNNMIDIGTGAGFPGIPLKILDNKINITLLDSLNKRVEFLNKVIDEIELTNVQTIHGRTEEIARNKGYREMFDICVSRAVAPLNVLLEYMLPMVKVGGKCICMKGNNVQEELDNSKNALIKLSAKITKIDTFNLPGTDIQRNIVIIEKTSKTSNVFPRKAGTPSKHPL